jgi:solute carrier family 35 protein
MKYEKVGSAVFYAIASFMITLANKIVLTSYNFRSYPALALGQIVITIIALQLASRANLIKLARFDLNTARRLSPIAFFHFGNLLFGLGGTQSLSLPMFTVMRRFSNLMTLYGELYILGKQKSALLQATIYLMVAGALIAAHDDLAFDPNGYFLITLNNLFTTANGIYTKQRLDGNKYGENDLLYYNSLLTLVPMSIVTFLLSDTNAIFLYPRWTDPGFLFFFILSSLMGFVLNYSWMMCTRYNSPLTTTVTGTLKNIVVTYLGMIVGGDYIFSNWNFVGLTVSSVASVVYSYLTFAQKPTPPSPPAKVSDQNKQK